MFQVLRLRIEGRVQGVGFRWSALAEAQRRGLQGWIRNVATGEVEALVEGPRASVAEFVAYCRHGPPGAQVSRVVVTEADSTGALGDFRVEHGNA